jgi:diguanylate cyclase (GGDEF)-like protein
LIEGQHTLQRRLPLEALNPESTTYYKQAVAGVYALMSGEIDVLVHSEPDIWHVARNLQISDEIRTLAQPLSYVNFATGIRAGVDSSLPQRLDVALRSVIESDKYQEISRRWFNGEGPCSYLCGVLWASLALIILGVMVMQWRRARQLAMMNEALQQQISDTTERLSEDNAYLQDLTVTDTLTGINNRRAFEQRLNELILRAEHHQHPFSLMIFDIDDFKKVNDEFGHDVGDQVLMDLVQRVTSIVRDGDTLCRWGGEEFTILMPQTARVGAINIAERCRRAVAGEAFAQIGFVTISVGVTSYLDGDKEGQIFKRADDALYRAKREGKNCVIWYDRSS